MWNLFPYGLAFVRMSEPSLPRRSGSGPFGLELFRRQGIAHIRQAAGEKDSCLDIVSNPSRHDLPHRLADFATLAEALDYAALGETGFDF